MFFEPNVEILAKKPNQAIEESEQGRDRLPELHFNATQLSQVYPNVTVLELFESIEDQDLVLSRPSLMDDA